MFESGDLRTFWVDPRTLRGQSLCERSATGQSDGQVADGMGTKHRGRAG